MITLSCVFFDFTKVYENLLNKRNTVMLPATMSCPVISCHVMSYTINVHTLSNGN